MLLTFTDPTVTAFVPVFFILRTIVLVVKLEVPLNATLVMVSDELPMKLNVRAPIHAATAMLTATVTAMSMIVAITGLRAFLFLVLIFLFIPPFGTCKYARGRATFKSYDSIHHIRYL